VTAPVEDLVLNHAVLPATERPQRLRKLAAGPRHRVGAVDMVPPRSPYLPDPGGSSALDAGFSLFRAWSCSPPKPPTPGCRRRRRGPS